MIDNTFILDWGQPKLVEQTDIKYPLAATKQFVFFLRKSVVWNGKKINYFFLGGGSATPKNILFKSIPQFINEKTIQMTGVFISLCMPINLKE